MFSIYFTEDDALHSVEIIAKEGETLESVRARANAQFFELHRPGVTDIIPCCETVDIRFSTGGRVYTYLVNSSLRGYTKAHIRDINGGFCTVDIISSKTRTIKELKAMAKSRGFRYEDYKVLHGIAVA